MPDNQNSIETIDQYISQYPEHVQEILHLIRAVIKESAPEAKEKISWQMPTFVLHGNLVHFAANKHHIGFYPAPSAVEAFKEDLAGYKWAKGTIQFPMNQPLPVELISRIVRFRVAENTRLAEEKPRKIPTQRCFRPDSACNP